jgi:hypothetical protein
LPLEKDEYSRRDLSSLLSLGSTLTYVFGTRVDAIRGCFLPDDRLLIPDSNTKTLFVCRIDGSNVKKFFSINIKKKKLNFFPL